MRPYDRREPSRGQRLPGGEHTDDEGGRRRSAHEAIFESPAPRMARRGSTQRESIRKNGDRCERGSLTCVDEKQGPKSVHRKKAERRAGCNKRAYGENRAQRPKQIRDTSGARACGQADHRGEPEQETDLLGRKPAGFEETRPERRGYAERGVDRGIEDNETRQFAGLEKHSGRPVSPP